MLTREWHKLRQVIKEVFNDKPLLKLFGSFGQLGKKEGVHGQTVRDRFKGGKLEIAYLLWLTRIYSGLKITLEDGRINVIFTQSAKISRDTLDAPQASEVAGAAE